MNKKISLSFSVDADSVSLKSICKKDFLELQMRAISTANPNLNGSWFTKEALLDAVDSCKNKPILGYFNADGDFESHNGVWRKDVETGLEYWDTSNGEQMLGMIRESDEIKVVDGDDGLSWLCLSCALWTQYNFKQVKRLFKDAKKAKETGGVTKNISVEIDILEGEKLDSGIYRIDKFNLLGITILGSRNGKKVQPGIAHAELSIPEIVGTELYAKQEHALRAAYSFLEGNDVDETKEDVLNMEKDENKTIVNEENNMTPAANFEDAGNGTDGTATDVTPTVGNNTVADNTPAPEAPAQATFTEGDVCPECGKNPCECSKAGEGEGEGEEGSKQSEEGGKQCHSDEQENTSEVRDIAWLTHNISYSFDALNETINYYEFLMEQHPEAAPHGAYIVSVLKRCLSYEKRIEGTLGGLLAKVAGEISEADEQYEAKLAQYEDIDALITNYEAKVAESTTLVEEKETIAKENDVLKTELGKYEQAKFLASIDELLSTAKIEEAVKKEIYEACKSGEITKYEDAKVKVALAAFDANHTDNIPQGDATPVVNVAPVDTPNVHAAFEDGAEKSSAKSTSSWDILREYTKK